MHAQDVTSFEALISENKARIYRLCRIYAVSPLTPEDLFQEVTIQIWKSYQSFEGKSSIATYIYKIALNVCIGAKTKFNKVREKTVRLDSIQFNPKQPLDNAIDDPKYKALQACINTLKPLDKSIIVLVLEGLKYKDIAAITGLTENNVAVRIKRSKHLLLPCITSKLV